MYLNADKTKKALDLSAEVLRALGINDASGQFIPVSIEEIQDYVEEKTTWAIEKAEVIYPQAQYIRARIHRFNDRRAAIHVRRDQETDWNGFAPSEQVANTRLWGGARQ
jgi:hypothetical protein